MLCWFRADGKSTAFPCLQQASRTSPRLECQPPPVLHDWEISRFPLAPNVLLSRSVKLDTRGLRSTPRYRERPSCALTDHPRRTSQSRGLEKRLRCSTGHKTHPVAGMSDTASAGDCKRNAPKVVGRCGAVRCGGGTDTGCTSCESVLTRDEHAPNCGHDLLPSLHKPLAPPHSHTIFVLQLECPPTR